MNRDTAEIDKFAALAHQWWDENGELRTLHQLNPLRLAWIEQQAGKLADKAVLDIGCGGGILSESMAKKGAAKVLGIDLAEKSIKVAKLHALEAQLPHLRYQTISAEDLAAQEPASFDIVTCMEMLEHVPDPSSIVAACSRLVKPGGHVFFSTLNRNPKSYLLAVIGAEYVLNLLPKGTHEYAKFIKPSELARWAKSVGLEPDSLTGMTYNPLTQIYRLTRSTDVNYLLHTVRIRE